MDKINAYLASPIFYILMLWSLYWKGRALWKAARKARKGWFIAILVLHTFGLFDIAYLYLLDKDKPVAEAAPAEPIQ